MSTGKVGVSVAVWKFDNGWSNGHYMVWSVAGKPVGGLCVVVWMSKAKYVIQQWRCGW